MLQILIIIFGTHRRYKTLGSLFVLTPQDKLALEYFFFWLVMWEPVPDKIENESIWSVIGDIFSPLIYINSYVVWERSVV